MSYPTDRIHRRPRGKMGRGQYPRPVPITATATPNATHVTLEFSGSVISTGPTGFTVASRSLVSQVLDNATHITLIFSAPVETLQYDFPGDNPYLRSVTGAQIIGMSGTFGGTMPITLNDILVSNGTGGTLGNRGAIAADGSVALANNQFLIDIDGQVTAVAYFGDGSNLTGLDFSQLSGTPPNPFDQTLNTTDTPAFNAIDLNAGGDVNIVGTWYTGTDASPSLSSCLQSFSNRADAAATGIIALNARVDATDAAIAALDARIDAIEATLATGVSGSLTPVTGTLQATAGIVTAID